MTAALTLRELMAVTKWSARHARRVARSLGVAPGERVPVSALSRELQDRASKHARRHLAVVPRPAEPQFRLELTPPAHDRASGADAHAEADRRYTAIAPLLYPDRHKAIWLQGGGTVEGTAQFLALQYGAGARTLLRWLARYRQGGYPALTDKVRADKGVSAAINDAAREFLASALNPEGAGARKITAAELYRTYRSERIRRPELPDLCYRTLLRWWDKIPRPAMTMAFEGPKAFSERHDILSHRDYERMAPLDWIVMDHRVLDVFCLVRDDSRAGRKLVRPWVTAAIDMRTRHWLAWVIVETPSSDSIAACLKLAILRHGLAVDRASGRVRTRAYWDNGRDFCSLWLEGGKSVRSAARRLGDPDRRVTGVLDTLGIQVTHSLPERARSKMIEPNFGRLSRVDQSTEWWCGRDPSERSERFDRMVERHERWIAGEIPVAERPFPEIAEVARIYDDAFRALNAQELRGPGMRIVTPAGQAWATPDQKWAELAPRVDIREADPAAIQMAFLRRTPPRKVRHSAVAVTWGGREYHYRCADAATLMELDERYVELGYDPLALETVAVYHDGQFVALASDIELRGMAAEDFVADERERRAQNRAVRTALDGLRQGPAFPTAAERMRRRAAVSTSAPCTGPAPATIMVRPTTASAEPAGPVHGNEAEAARFDFWRAEE